MSKTRHWSSFIRALGISQTIWLGLVESVQALGGKEEDFFRLATPEGRSVLEEMAKAIVSGGRQQNHTMVPVTIDYDSVWEKAFETVNGHHLHSHFNLGHFPIQTIEKQSGKVPVTLELVHTNHKSNQRDVLRAFAERGLVRPGVEHFLTLGLDCAEMMAEHPVIAFVQQPWKNSCGLDFVPYYTGCKDTDKDFVGVTRTDSVWDSSARFLGVRPRANHNLLVA